MPQGTSIRSSEVVFCVTKHSNEKLLLVNGEGTRNSATEGPRPWESPIAPGLPRAKTGISTSSFMDDQREDPSRSGSVSERNRAARFHAVVDVVYYDSKKSPKLGNIEGKDGPNVTADSDLGVAERSVCGFADEGEEYASHRTRSSSHRGGNDRFIEQRHATNDAVLS